MSDTVSDSDSSVSNKPSSYRENRPRRKATTCSNYSEKHNRDSDSSDCNDGQAELKRRLEDFLGEDSGSDEDFVPSAKKKKRLKHEELSNIQNAQVKTSRTKKIATKVCKEKDKKKKAYGVLKKENTKRKDSRPKLTTVEEAGAEESEVNTGEESEVNTANEAETEAEEKTADETETDAGNGAETDVDDAEVNTAEKSENINENEGGGRSYLFSNIFQRPSLLKRLKGPRCISVFSGKRTDRNSKVFINIPGPWLKYLNQLITDLKEVTTHQGLDQSLGFLKCILSARSSGILEMGARTTSNWTLNLNIGCLIVDSIAENIDDMELKVNQLCWLAKFFLKNTWSRFRFTFIRIIKHLLNLGALQDALDLLEDHNMVIPDNLDTDLQDFIAMIYSVNNMINNTGINTNETSQNEEELDHISVKTIQLIERTGHEYSYMLPLLSWYITKKHDVQGAADTLKYLRDSNLSDERTHRVFINFLKKEDFESDHIIEAQKSASEEFPYRDFAVDYCQGLLQKDEDLDKSFEDEIDNLQENRTDLEDSFEKLVKYFDFSLNMNDEVSWSILVNTSIQLIRSDWGKQVIIRHINPRADWWFDQCLETMEDSSNLCLGHQLLFIKICFGESSYYEKIMCTLTDRLGSDKSTLDNFLRQVPVELEFPLIQTAQDFKIQDEDNIVSDEISHVQDYRRRLKMQSSNSWYKNSKCQSSKEKHVTEKEKKIREETGFLKTPTYFKNFLYMKRRSKFALLQKYVDCVCNQDQKVRVQKKEKKDMLQHFLDPARHRDKILRCLKRNITEETLLENIIQKEFGLSYESKFVLQYLRTTVLPRIESCIDWSPINNVKLPQDNKLILKFKRKFLWRCDVIMRGKLNPRLGVNLAKKECRQEIYSKTKSRNIGQLNDELDQLENLAIFLIKGFEIQLPR